LASDPTTRSCYRASSKEERDAIEADLHIVGADCVNRFDDSLGTSAAVPPRHLLGLPFDIGHGQATRILAGELGGTPVCSPGACSIRYGLWFVRIQPFEDRLQRLDLRR
jgi:hypothetical protein